MKALFGFQDLLDTINSIFIELSDKLLMYNVRQLKKPWKKDCKALFLINQCVDVNIFEKIGACTNSKEAWNKLKQSYKRGDKVRNVRLHSLCRQYELLHMELIEKISYFFIKVVILSNQMIDCAKTSTNQTIIENIRRILTP